MEIKEIEAYFESQVEPVKGCLLALRSVIMDFDPQITEAWKWRLPFYCYRGKTFCYLWIDKKTKLPYVGVVEGGRIDHPMLEQGDRTRMKVMYIQPEEDLPVEALYEILSEARKYY